MNLTDITREYIKRFAGSTMFERGEGYYRSGNVTNLEYNEDAATITADVEGNYGNHSVLISEEDGEIGADCDCPYDGYPCKHMAAVMLEFAENKSEYLKKMTKSKRQGREMSLLTYKWKYANIWLADSRNDSRIYRIFAKEVELWSPDFSRENSR